MIFINSPAQNYFKKLNVKKKCMSYVRLRLNGVVCRRRRRCRDNLLGHLLISARAIHCACGQIFPFISFHTYGLCAYFCALGIWILRYLYNLILCNVYASNTNSLTPTERAFHFIYSPK